MNKNQNKDLFELNTIIPEKLGISTKLTFSMLNVSSHIHSFYEIFYVINGEIRQNLNDNLQVLVPGDCFLLTPNDTHSLRSDGHSVHRDILISKELFESVVKILTDSYEDFDSFIKQANTGIRISLDEIIELENIAQQYTATMFLPKKRAFAITLLLSILTKFLNAHNLTDTITTTSIIDRIFNTINTISGLKGGIPYLVNHLKYSDSYLRHIFKKKTGIKLSLYIKNLRLDYIEFYLKTSNYTLQEIASIVGIDSLPYLNKIFKEKYSIPPIKYRKLYCAKKETISD